MFSYYFVYNFPLDMFSSIESRMIFKYDTNGRCRTRKRRSIYTARCFMRELTVLNPAYTLPGGEPRMRETIASRAILMFWKDPMIWILLEVPPGEIQGQTKVIADETHVSARTIRVRLVFSMVNLVLPSCPAIRPGENVQPLHSDGVLYEVAYRLPEKDDLRAAFSHP